MSWVAVAIGGATLINGMMQGNATSNAASAQTNAANQANATQTAQYNQTRQDQLPWMNRGNAAGNQLAYLMGLPGYAPQGWGQQPGGPGGANPWAGATAGVYGGQPNGPQGYIDRPNTVGGEVTGGQPYGPQGYIDRPYGTGGEATGWQPGGPGGVRGRFLSMANQMSMDDQLGGGVSSGPNAFTGGGTLGGPFSAGNSGTPNAGASPYNTAMGGYGSLTTPFSATNWQADPGYAWRLQQGQNALERSGSAKGMTLSGAQNKALLDYGQGAASQEYGAAYGRYNNDQTNLFNRLSGIAGTGQQANQFVGQLGANYANQVGQNQLGAGNAAAAGYIGTANAWGNALNSGMNQWNNYNAWNSLNNSGGGYGGWGSSLGGSQTGPFGTNGAWASTYRG